MAFIRAIQNGLYSSTSTWSGGVVPTTGDVACADTFRITLDVSPEAALSVASDDLVSAGGVAALTRTGGFNVPNESTTAIPAGIRYDFHPTTARASTITVPLYIINGTVTIGDIVYVAGYASNTASMNVVLVSPTTTVFVTTQAIQCPSNVAALPSTSAILLFAPNFDSTWDWTSNGVVAYTGTYVSNPPRLVFTSSTTTPFNITINADIGMYAGNVSTTPTVDIVVGSSTLPNQNITINTPSLLTTGVLTSNAGRGIIIANVHNIEFTQDFTIGQPAWASLAAVDFTVTSLRGTVSFAGTLTVQTNACMNIAGPGHLSVVGNVLIPYVGATTNFSIGLSGNVEFLGDIILTSSISQMHTGGAVTISASPASMSFRSLRYGVGNQTFSPMVSVTGTTSTPITINGDVDATNMRVTSTTFATGALFLSSTYTGAVTVIGDVTGAETGNTELPSIAAGAIVVASSATPRLPMIIEGNVFGGSRAAGIVCASGAIIEVNVLGAAIGGTVNLGLLSASPALVGYNALFTVDTMSFGPQGQFPVFGLCKFNDPTSASVTAPTTTTSVTLMAGNTLPTAANVRSGVTVGNATGTLVVPQAANVLDGIVYDNGTEGTFSVGGGDTISLLENISDILAGADHMGYTLDPQWSNVKIHVDVDAGEALISSNGTRGAVHEGITVDTVNKFRGRNSLKFTATSGIKVFSNSLPLFTSTTSPFTLEMYVNPTEYPAVSTLKMIFSLPNNINLEIKSNQTLGLWVSANTASPVYVSSTEILPLNTWSHIAVTRDGDIFKVYLNGIQIILLNRPSTTYPVTGLDVWIGAASFNANYGFVGNMRDITFTDNVQRYTATFAVPTVCYPYIVYSTVAGDKTLAGRINAVKSKTDQLTFTGGNVNATSSESASLVTVATAIADGLWSSVSIWDTGVVPDASTFVYTNGKAVTVSNTVNCAGYADTPDGGDGVVVDEDGNAVLITAFGDTLFSDNKVLATLQGNLSNIGSATLTANSYAMGYGTAPVALFGRTQFARKSAFHDPIQAGVVFPMPVVNNSVGLTVEFWWYPLADNNGTYFGSSFLGLIPTYGDMVFFSGGSAVQISNVNASIPGVMLTLQWNHCVIQRTKAGNLEVYVNGVRHINSANAPAIAAGNWQLFAAQPNYSAGMWGYFADLRVTLSSSGTRYNGNFSVPTAPPTSYAPPPGTTLTGRLILQNDGAVIQSTVAPTVSVAGVLSSLSRYTRAYIGQVGDSTGAIKAKTDQLTFTANGVVADNGTDYTSRFNSLDTATAGIKAKTDQLTFTVSGVLADAGGTDYTTRFNSLDTAVAQIPTLTYTSRFNSIDTDLGNLTAGGGVDFTPVLNAIANVDSDVASVATGVSGIKSKTDQFTFGTNGVEADVAVSVAAVINYDSRFTALDTEVAAVKAKTDQLTFTTGAVNANATVDVTPIVTAVNSAITPVGTAVANLDSDLQVHDAEIKTQLTTIQNATGAIDLTPITTGLATVNTNVLAIPTATYTTRFNSLDTSVSTIISDVADVQTSVDAIAVDVGNVSVDLTPVLTAVGGVQTSVDNISVDLTPVLSSVAGVQATANLIKVKTDTITPCDISGVVDAVDTLTERFNAVPSGPVTVTPQATATTTTLFGYCRHQNGTPAVGEQVTVYVQQAGGSAALLSAEGQVLTSGADGLVACTVPRGTQFVYAVKYGNRIERVSGVDAPSLAMPSIIER